MWQTLPAARAGPTTSGGISLFRSSLINARSISLSSLSSDVLEALEVSDILEGSEVLEVCGVFLLLSSTNSFLTSRAATPTSCPQTAATPGTTSSTTDTSRKPTAHPQTAAASSLLTDPATVNNIMPIPSIIRAA